MPRVPGRSCFLLGGEGSFPGERGPSCPPAPGTGLSRGLSPLGDGAAPSHPSGLAPGNEIKGVCTLQGVWWVMVRPSVQPSVHLVGPRGACLGPPSSTARKVMGAEPRSALGPILAPRGVTLAGRDVPWGWGSPQLQGGKKGKGVCGDGSCAEESCCGRWGRMGAGCGAGWGCDSALAHPDLSPPSPAKPGWHLGTRGAAGDGAPCACPRGGDRGQPLM